MWLRSLLLPLLVAVLAATVVVQFGSQPKSAVNSETSFERVQRTQTIRCAYATAAGLHVKDPNTGAYSGIFYELMEEIGRRLKKQIIWAEEVSYDDINVGFASNRYDMFCSALWQASARANGSLLTAPIYLSPVYAWVSPKNAARVPTLDALNASDLVLSIAEGDATATMAQSRLPNMKTKTVGNITTVGQYIGEVTTGHAGAVLTDPGIANDFLQHNPGSIVRVGDQPVVVFPTGMALKIGDHDLKAAVDLVIREMIHDGTTERLLQKYNRVGAILPVPKSY